MATTPFNTVYPQSGRPLSNAELQKRMGRNPLYEFLKFYAKSDVFFEFHDFAGKALDTTNAWTVGTGATATAYAITAAANGMIRGVAGTTAATSGLQIVTPTKLFYGDQNCGVQVRFRPSVITEGRIEVGFVDAKPSANTNIVNSLTTPTFNTAVDAALFVYDDASSTVTQGLYTVGDNSQAAAKSAITSGLTASTWMTVRVQLIGDNVHLWVNGTYMAGAVSGIEGGSGLIAGVCSKSSDTTDRNIDIDYIAYWAERV